MKLTVETLREDAEREDRLARACTDPVGKTEHETRADTFWRRYERAHRREAQTHD